MSIKIGSHVARIEGDVLYLELVEDLSMPDLEAYIQLADQVVAEHGSFYIVDDITNFRSAAADVRRRIADWLGSNACAGAVLHGGSLAARTVAILVVRAMSLLGKQSFPIVFMRTEREARDWIASHRHKGKS